MGHVTGEATDESSKRAADAPTQIGREMAQLESTVHELWRRAVCARDFQSTDQLVRVSHALRAATSALAADHIGARVTEESAALACGIVGAHCPYESLSSAPLD